MPEKLSTYTHGSCTNNGDENARAGSGVWFSNNDPGNISIHMLNGHNTNNGGEVLAILSIAQRIAQHTELDQGNDGADIEAAKGAATDFATIMHHA